MKIYSLLTYSEALFEAGLLLKSNIINPVLAVEDVTYNSKAVKEYSLFACKGAAFKKDYLDEAVDNKASCYLSEVEYDTNIPISFFIVSDIRAAMALVADMFFDKAYKKLRLIGITGTKGKTTTAYYIKYILDEYLQGLSKKPCGLMSSIEIYDGIVKTPAHLTTPEAFELHRHFDNAVSAGLSYFVMEVSSQALKYDRVLGVDFEYSVFLNIGEDHISPYEHSDFEDYFSSKLKIFSQSENAVINLDADYSDRILQAAEEKLSKSRILTFSGSKEKEADFLLTNVKRSGKQTDTVEFSLRFSNSNESHSFLISNPGLFNACNAAAAIAVCSQYKIPRSVMASGLEKARVPGRMEVYRSENKNITVVVDYAHNKLSFERIYESVKSEYKDCPIITVFGCPGDKAFNRRKELGELSGKNSERVYLTMDDPGFEQISDISLETAEYIKKYPCEYFLIDSREEAIKTAISDAPKNAVVLILGKGHENCHKVKGKLLYCDTDADCTKRCLALLGADKKKT